MHTKLPCFVTTSRYYTTVAGTTHQYGLVFKPAVLLALYGYEKGIQVKM
jgi:hypothetical protein